MPDDEIEAMFDDPEDEEDEQPEPAAKANPMSDIRKRLREAERRAKAAEEKNKELEPFKVKFDTQERESAARDALKAAGLPETSASVFARVHEGEITEDAARSFGEQIGLAPQKPETTTGETQGFEPTAGGEAPGPEQINRTDLDRMVQENTINAIQAVDLIRQGRVQFTSPEARDQLKEARTP